MEPCLERCCLFADLYWKGIESVVTQIVWGLSARHFARPDGTRFLFASRHGGNLS